LAGYPDLNAEQETSVHFIDRNRAKKILAITNLPPRVKRQLQAQEELLMESGPETRRKLRTAEVLLTMFHFGDTDHGRHEQFAWERFEALEWLGDNAQQLVKFTDALRECFEYLTDKVVKDKMSTRILPHVERQWKKSKLMEIDVHVWDRMHAEHPNRNLEYILDTIDGEIEKVRRTEALEYQDKQEEARKAAHRT